MRYRDFSRYAEFVTRNYKDIVAQMRECAKISGMKLTEIGGVELNGTSYSLYNLTNQNGRKLSACLSSGMHGDEYEGIFALLELVRRNPKLLRRFNLTIFPVLNPAAYIEGKRDLIEGEDDSHNMNRTFGKENAPLEVKLIEQSLGSCGLFMDLHSSDTNTGFFCYERRRRKLPSLGRRMVLRLKPRFPIDTTDDGDIENYNGVLRTNQKREGSIEAFAFKKGALWSLTLEVALSLESFEKRVACGYLALKAGLEEFWKLKERCN